MFAETIASPWLWGGFGAVVLCFLAIDLGVFHRQAHAVKWREALAWTTVWVVLALLFNVFLYYRFGSRVALEFFTGYLIEKALSVDNIFVFLMIFSFFAVPQEAQHRVLFWGVLGALVMRALFILAGASLLQRFHWMMYVFGAVLLIGAIKLLLMSSEQVHPERNPLVKLAARLFPVAKNFHGHHFTVVRDGRTVLTPLALVLISIETTDVIFAVDSIPAIFAVTSDPFIVYTSNVFAILGLRALYFVLAGALDKFHYLKPALSAILAFVGVKMLLVDVVKIPIVLSLLVIVTLLAVAAIASLIRARRVASRGTEVASEVEAFAEVVSEREERRAQRR